MGTIEIIPVPNAKTQSAVQSDTHREVNYIFMRMQRLKKANGQKIAKLLAVVA